MGKAQHMLFFARPSPPSHIFSLLCQQLLSCKDFISPVQRAMLGGLGHRPQPARIFSLSPDCQSLPQPSTNQFGEIFMAPLSPQCGGRACFPSTSFALREIWDVCSLHEIHTRGRVLCWVAFLCSLLGQL